MATYNYLEMLTAKQAAWCEANGIAFKHDAKYHLSYFLKGDLAICLARGAARCGLDVEVTRAPSEELDGSDMNDGERVVVRNFPTVRAALGFLATAAVRS